MRNSSINYILYFCGTLVTTDELQSVIHFKLQTMTYIMVRCLCCTFYGSLTNLCKHVSDITVSDGIVSLPYHFHFYSSQTVLELLETTDHVSFFKKNALFIYSYVHTFLGHFSPMSPAPSFPLPPTSLLGRTCSALFSNFFEEYT
jgi:hypothetical protein